VAVDDSYQRHGLGKKLLLTMQQQARSEGKNYLSLDVDCTNAAAISFYQKHGFKQQNQSIVSAKMQALGIGQHLHLVQKLI
jgi:ribosomal protein S18 acetylase RimI-like enzyme